MKATNTFICEDCNVTFQVYGSKKRGGYFCPVCGDSVAVRKYTPERWSKDTVKIKWSEKELKILQDGLKEGMAPYQIALLTGRSINSVLKKAQRLREVKTNG